MNNCFALQNVKIVLHKVIIPALKLIIKEIRIYFDDLEETLLFLSSENSFIVNFKAGIITL